MIEADQSAIKFWSWLIFRCCQFDVLLGRVCRLSVTMVIFTNCDFSHDIYRQYFPFQTPAVSSVGYSCSSSNSNNGNIQAIQQSQQQKAKQGVYLNAYLLNNGYIITLVKSGPAVIAPVNFPNFDRKVNHVIKMLIS